MKENALGHDHSVVAVTYMNLGTLQMYRENSVKALEYAKEALCIYEVHLTLVMLNKLRCHAHF